MLSILLYFSADRNPSIESMNRIAAVIAVVALAKAAGKLNEKDKEQIIDILIPSLADSSANMDEAAWVKVPEEFITKNTASLLEFYIPRDIQTGKEYLLAVRTSIRGSNELKSAVTGFSKIAVTVEE